jgi:hypothetical protein
MSITVSARRAGTAVLPPDQGAQHAARLGAANPAWLVLWGRYDRAFWAFPRFCALPGTIITEADPAAVLAAMRAAERAAAPGAGRDHQRGDHPDDQVPGLPPVRPAVPAPGLPRTRGHGYQHRAQS